MMIQYWGKRRLTKDLELMILAETAPGGVCSNPVNKTRLYKAGTVITCTGGSDTSYYVRIGDKQDVLVVIPAGDYESLCANSEKVA
jgi:hypothetical protein